MSMEISEVTRNTKILIDGVPYAVEDVNFVKPGKGRAIYRIKMRNLFDGVAREITYHSGDKVEEVSIVAHDMQYLYEEGDHNVFMDTESYGPHPVNKDLLGDKSQFLKEGLVVSAGMMASSSIRSWRHPRYPRPCPTRRPTTKAACPCQASRFRADVPSGHVSAA